MYREILESGEETAEVLHLLGVAEYQSGAVAEGRRLIERAIALDPGPPPFHANLAAVCLASGDLSAAEVASTRALSRDPGNTRALEVRTAVQLERREWREAAATARRLLQADGDSVEALLQLAVAERGCGNADLALAVLRRAVNADPSHGMANNALGEVLLERGELDSAAFVLEEAIGRSPGLVEAWCNLARVRISQTRLEEAEIAARRARELAGAGTAKVHFVLGEVLRQAGRIEEAEQELEQALNLDPERPSIQQALGQLRIPQGRFGEAEEHLRSALRRDPARPLAWEALTRVRRFGINDVAILHEINEQLERFREKPAWRLHLEFALAKVQDDLGNHAQAAAHLDMANSLTRSIRASPGARFDPKDFENAVPAELVGRGCEIGHESTLPIFVVGLPRSGTTLVEQILASHPEVSSAGEVGFFQAASRQLADKLGGESYPYCLDRLGKAQVREIAFQYLERLERDRHGARHVVDKYPDNFAHLGFISLVFPRARIVHCVRDPRDTCLSIYSQHFRGPMEYAYDLQEIVEHMKFHRQVMNHWRSTEIGARLHTVRYEALVTDQERQTRALLDHCGLSWNDSSLRPHESRIPVFTSSHWQVRQPVNSGAIGRWRNYKELLAPVLSELVALREGSGNGADEVEL